MISTKSIIPTITFMIMLSLNSLAADQLKVRVVDVGTGLCCLIKCPDGKCLVYDTGDKSQNIRDLIIKELKKLLGSSPKIDLMILSHTDIDHIGSSEKIIDSFSVGKVIHTGFHKGLTDGNEYSCDMDGATETYKRFISKIKENGIPETNLCCEQRNIDSTWSWGEVNLKILCGFGKPPEDWKLNSEAKKINAVSIVLKIEYKGKSVLFCGDAVGCNDEESSDTPIATEKFLLKNKQADLKSDVMIAPHHGAENASSYEFIETVEPNYVIFSAGSKYQHPRKVTAFRYIDIMGSYLDAFSDNLNKYIFRTDKGEGHPDCDRSEEWKQWCRKGNCNDKIGDDSVTILIKSNGQVKVTQGD